jgi:hypothetical protein
MLELFAPSCLDVHATSILPIQGKCGEETVPTFWFSRQTLTFNEVASGDANIERSLE